MFRLRPGPADAAVDGATERPNSESLAESRAESLAESLGEAKATRRRLNLALSRRLQFYCPARFAHPLCPPALPTRDRAGPYTTEI